MTTPTRLAPFPLTDPAQITDPYPQYRHCRETDPVHRVPSTDGGPDTSYLFRYDDVSRLLRAKQAGREPPPGATPLIPARYGTLRQVVADWLVFLDPPRHTLLRAVVAQRFTAGMIEDLRPRIERLAHSLTSELRRHDHADLVEGFAAPLPILVISELLGIPAADRRWIRAQALALQRANSSRGGDPDRRFSAAQSAARQLLGYFSDEIGRRRRAPRRDLITHLVTADPSGAPPMTDDEIAATSIHLLTAGHETSTNLIGKAVLALLPRTGLCEQVRSGGLTLDAVDELIRYDAPVQMVTRWMREPLLVDGHEIPAGSRAVLVLGSANRDPAYVPDPDRLDLHRTAGRHLGFGLGIHYCLGAALARAEAQIGLTALFRDLPGLSLAGPPAYADDLVFHGPSRVPIRTR
ncbi:cytochrome P450 [Krasilnikovia cinnamomea]|uniref:Cytochrome P450 n=1 Tax=Krasilnikovia cinnamomea TaxID=349313 RepID=A0A4Q7ZS72_9ACTN|nr:cytochrome P450 [Krasilnikovia cinnamomea]RZU53309.1 cytochrome P450 [Krasilnikovia cinnamomea]